MKNLISSGKSLKSIVSAGLGVGNSSPKAEEAAPTPQADLKYSRIFKESFEEIEKMLSQNIMPKLQDTEEYQTAFGAYMLRQQEEHGFL